MNVTPKHKQIQVLSALVEGNSIRSTERMTGVHRDTIMRLLVRIGNKGQKIMDEQFQGFHCKKLQADEIWTFVKKKRGRMTRSEELKDLSVGDQYVFVALDPDTKLVPTFVIGKRNKETACIFMQDLRTKLNGNGTIQLTTDGFTSYVPAVQESFRGAIHFAQVTKVFASDYTEPGRYAPPKIKEVLSKIINGKPDPKHVSTSYVERQNLTIRMQMRRFTRLTNAFSKKLENLKAAVSLHFWHYNFMRIHRTLRVTPAMEAGITDHVWGWDELLA